MDLDKTQVKLLPCFTSKLFGYPLISWMTDYAHNRRCFDMFHIKLVIDREFHC